MNQLEKSAISRHIRVITDMDYLKLMTTPTRFHDAVKGKKKGESTTALDDQPQAPITNRDGKQSLFVSRITLITKRAFPSSGPDLPSIMIRRAQASVAAISQPIIYEVQNMGIPYRSQVDRRSANEKVNATTGTTTSRAAPVRRVTYDTRALETARRIRTQMFQVALGWLLFPSPSQSQPTNKATKTENLKYPAGE